MNYKAGCEPAFNITISLIDVDGIGVIVPTDDSTLMAATDSLDKK
ncbi:MAG: hypothetical protein OEW68_04000 [Gammaproteobacteria bacterium]|nr:hypothetical protein [Gammaproteobacteria bacterium]MDH4313984.1 hypothetical protein [Gammaproteobacteria bacterium]MDH5212718.1 hypothetical protein [Gammaproteobacteria bacterium]